MSRSKKNHQIFNVTIHDWVLFDPSFSKKYDSYFPLSASFLNSKEYEALSNVSFRLLIGLLKEAHRSSKGVVKVDERYWKANGKLLERSLYELQEFQILTFSPNKGINELKEEINKGDFAPLEPNLKKPAKEFSNISNPTEIQHTALTKSLELSEIENLLRSENVLGGDIPPALKIQKSMSHFCTRILVSYSGSVEDFKRDLRSIINESLVDKISPSGKSDYLVARMKKKALEVYNAAH